MELFKQFGVEPNAYLIEAIEILIERERIKGRHEVWKELNDVMKRTVSE